MPATFPTRNAANSAALAPKVCDGKHASYLTHWFRTNR